MRSDRYHVKIQALRNGTNEADLIAIAQRKPTSIEYSQGGSYVIMTFGYKYRWQALHRFDKFTKRRRIRVILENR